MALLLVEVGTCRRPDFILHFNKQIFSEIESNFLLHVASRGFYPNPTM